jgi:hypothetical protein
MVSLAHWHNPEDAYMVGFNYQITPLTEGSRHTQPEINNSLSINTNIHNGQIEANAQNLDIEHLPLLQYLFDICMDLNKHVKDSKYG